MKANELRIGNLVEYQIHDELSSPKLEWVEWVDIDDLKAMETSENYRPILLTEEWLLKFGFIKTSLHYFKYNSIILNIEDNGFQCLLGFQCVNLQYVHELQNLYFALTGRELTYGGNK